MMDRPTGSLADYLAAERTFLAWIRTGLALMGFGFVVARFGLFLEALAIGQPGLAVRTIGVSPWLGTVLIALGIAVNLVSCWRYTGQIRDLKSGESGSAQSSSLAISVAILMAAIGVAMAVYLISVRQSPRARLDIIQEKSMSSNSGSGITTIPGHQSVDQTVQKLQEILQAKGVKLFALVDHSGEAEKAGMHMRNTKLLIFGNPKAGTPLMLASPSVAIDLPLKVLVWEDGDGSVKVSYNAPGYLQTRHGLPPDLVQNIAVVETLAAKAAE